MLNINKRNVEKCFLGSERNCTTLSLESVDEKNTDDNIKAIKLLKQIESENRFATPEEQEILAKYSGWGGLPKVFDTRAGDWQVQQIEA